MPDKLRYLKEAADNIEKYIVKPRVHDIWVSFLIQFFYVCIILVLGVVANLAPNTTTVIGSLGLGTLGVATNYQRLQKAVNQLLKDKRALEDFVGQIRIHISLCHENDPQSIQFVEDFISKGLEKLTK